MRNLFFKNLHKIGYRYFNLKKSYLKDQEIVKAFQSRFTPSLVNGKIDQKTFKISLFLANKIKK